MFACFSFHTTAALPVCWQPRRLFPRGHCPADLPGCKWPGLCALVDSVSSIDDYREGQLVLFRQVCWSTCLLLQKANRGDSRREKNSIQKGTMLSLAIICAMIFLLVPWQVAYLGCWMLHLYTCSSGLQRQKSLSRSKHDIVALVQMKNAPDTTSGISQTLPGRPPSGSTARATLNQRDNNLNHNLHLLLLMTWLLPLTAPVLAVWVRTLLTAGFTTPFDGDHNFIAVLPFLILTDYASWTPGNLFERPRYVEAGSALVS